MFGINERCVFISTIKSVVNYCCNVVHGNGYNKR